MRPRTKDFMWIDAPERKIQKGPCEMFMSPSRLVPVVQFGDMHLVRAGTGFRREVQVPVRREHVSEVSR